MVFWLRSQKKLRPSMCPSIPQQKLLLLHPRKRKPKRRHRSLTNKRSMLPSVFMILRMNITKNRVNSRSLRPLVFISKLSRSFPLKLKLVDPRTTFKRGMFSTSFLPKSFRKGRKDLHLNLQLQLLKSQCKQNHLHLLPLNQQQKVPLMVCLTKIIFSSNPGATHHFLEMIRKLETIFNQQRKFSLTAI